MIAKKCYHIAFFPFPFLIISFFLSKFYWIFKYIFLLLLLLQAFFIFFFRDLKREIQDGIVSPADGRVMENEGKISIFMSLLDMHVNLMPYDGKISKIIKHEGKHAFAFLQTEKNEKFEIEIESDIGKIRVFQIAGFFARRIVQYVKEGDYLKKGEKIGIIRFGSRIELMLPDNCKICVEKGKKVRAGEKIAVVL